MKVAWIRSSYVHPDKLRWFNFGITEYQYLQKQNIKSYDFASFSNGIAESDDGAINSNYKKDDNFNNNGINIKFMSIIYRSHKR